MLKIVLSAECTTASVMQIFDTIHDDQQSPDVFFADKKHKKEKYLFSAICWANCPFNPIDLFRIYSFPLLSTSSVMNTQRDIFLQRTLRESVLWRLRFLNKGRLLSSTSHSVAQLTVPSYQNVSLLRKWALPALYAMCQEIRYIGFCEHVVECLHPHFLNKATATQCSALFLRSQAVQ